MGTDNFYLDCKKLSYLKRAILTFIIKKLTFYEKDLKLSYDCAGLYLHFL